MKWRDEWGQANTGPKRNAFYAKVEEAWFTWKPLLKSMYPGKTAEDLDPEETKKYQEALKKKKPVNNNFIKSFTALIIIYSNLEPGLDVLIRRESL